MVSSQSWSDKLNAIAQAAAEVFLAKLGIKSIRTKKGVVLGTGWGNHVVLQKSVPFEELDPIFQTLEGIHGHARRIGIATIAGTRVVVLSGRIHMYEQNPDALYVLMRILWELGVRKLVLTNAVGGMRKSVGKGDIIVVDSVIKNGPSPLKGARFTDPNSLLKQDLIRRIWIASGITAVHIGGIVVSPGPEFESPEDRQFIDRPGVLGVGMSPYADMVCWRYFADTGTDDDRTAASVIVISCCSNSIGDSHGHKSNVGVMNANADRLAAMLYHVIFTIS